MYNLEIFTPKNLELAACTLKLHYKLLGTAAPRRGRGTQATSFAFGWFEMQVVVVVVFLSEPLVIYANEIVFWFSNQIPNNNNCGGGFLYYIDS